MIDLYLVKSYKQKIEQTTVTRYKIDPQESIDLPAEVVLYTILENYGDQKTINFRELLTGTNLPGAVFTLTAEGLHNLSTWVFYRSIWPSTAFGNNRKIFYL